MREELLFTSERHNSVLYWEDLKIGSPGDLFIYYRFKMAEEIADIGKKEDTLNLDNVRKLLKKLALYRDSNINVLLAVDDNYNVDVMRSAQ